MSFDPETHDPFAGYDDNRETHHRINQMRAKLGHSYPCSDQPNQRKSAVVMPEDWAPIDQHTDDITQADSVRISKLDRNPDAQLLAKETVYDHRHAVKLDNDGETIFMSYDGRHLDPSDPIAQVQLRKGCPYGLFAANPRWLFPLAQTDDWKAVAEQHLSWKTSCDVEVAIGCKKTAATVHFAIKRGDFVCIYKSCTKCREWFDESDEDRRQFHRRDLGTSLEELFGYAQPQPIREVDDDEQDPWG